MAVNLSARQFNQIDIYNWLQQTLVDLAIDPNFLLTLG